MNADQLWRQLDKNARSLLRVKVMIARRQMKFSKLMGDIVESREFIQDNALNVANLDY